MVGVAHTQEAGDWQERVREDAPLLPAPELCMTGVVLQEPRMAGPGGQAATNGDQLYEPASVGVNILRHLLLQSHSASLSSTQLVVTLCTEM